MRKYSAVLVNYAIPEGQELDETDLPPQLLAEIIAEEYANNKNFRNYVNRRQSRQNTGTNWKSLGLQAAPLLAGGLLLAGAGWYLNKKS